MTSFRFLVGDRMPSQRLRLIVGLSLCIAGVGSSVQAASPLPPTLDLSAETSRQTVIAAGDAQTYQGHPTTRTGKRSFAFGRLDTAEHVVR